MKIKVKFQNGRSRVLKSSEQLNDIDKNREAHFVMMNGRVYTGWCDGEIDYEGNFGVWRTIHCIGLPFKGLLGWCYVKGR